jgi:predicted DNA-binding transcriptional regulator YafY
LVEGPKRRLSVTLNFAEMLALTTGRDLLAGLSGTFFHEAAISALEKVRAALPEPLLARADASAELVVADKRPARNYRGRSRDVQILVEAIRRHETVSLVPQTRRKQGRAAPCRPISPAHPR